jgi:tripartite ATP-independent transporter DctM subunit
VREILDIAMFAAACLALLAGFPVAFTLAGVALAFALLGMALGVFDPGFLSALPQRIFGVMTNEVLIAVPLFIFMGVMLERSRVAEDLLVSMSQLLRETRSGLGVAVILVGMLLAASTGIIGATVVTLGLLSLPAMLRAGYSPRLAAGSICAAGSLGQIIPPSIALVLLGDVISGAYQKAQFDLGNFAPEPVSVGNLFAGALLPGLLLVALYLAYHMFLGRPTARPGRDPDTSVRTEIAPRAPRLLLALLPPLLLIVFVLGSILAGIATPTEAASVGAVGALLLAAARQGGRSGWAALLASGCLLGLLMLAAFLDLRLGRASTAPLESLGIGAAFLLSTVAAAALLAVLWRLWRDGLLGEALRRTTKISCMIFVILIGATLFSLVFRGLGGESMVQEFLTGMPGGLWGAVFTVMAVIFLLGFFLDFVEITFVVVPLVAPALLALGVDPVWLGVMIALNLQTSFMTPPFGLALFYLRGVAPETLSTGDIYRGAFPFVILQLLALAILAAYPPLATWLPGLIFEP